MPKSVTIVGGGLAGLGLGLALRQHEVPVTIWESGRYPRHRVCGEFISGAGLDALRRPGLADTVPLASRRMAETAAFFGEGINIPPRPLPEPALCISRHVLDDLLARAFVQAGGRLLTGERWCGPCGEGVVRASGRRLEALSGRWRWFGLKVHAEDVRLVADVEMHFIRNGYVGMCRLPGGRVNICGLFRSRTTEPHLSRDWRSWLRGGMETALHARLAEACFDEKSFCSIAGLSLIPVRAAGNTECCIGDALTMIPPVTGNGMSMAFESADLAVEPLLSYCHGRSGWRDVVRQVAAACDQRFTRRLRWAAWFQGLLFQPTACRTLLRMGRHSPRLWRLAFRTTR